MSRRSISDRATAPAPASAWPRPTAQSGLYEGAIATTRQSTGQNLAPADDNTVSFYTVSLYRYLKNDFSFQKAGNMTQLT